MLQFTGANRARRTEIRPGQRASTTPRPAFSSTFQGQRLATSRDIIDNWSNADLLKALTGKDAEDPGHLSRGESYALRDALMKEDQRRKLAEPTALLAQEQGQAAGE